MAAIEAEYGSPLADCVVSALADQREQGIEKQRRINVKQCSSLRSDPEWSLN